MIDTIKFTEKDYRDVKMDSSSSIKEFSLDRKKYHRKYILDETIKDKDTQAIMMGQLVELLLWEPELFDEKFYMSACVSVPTGLMLAFVEAMYTVTKSKTDENGTVDATFEEIATEAYEMSGFKIKVDAVIKKFAESDAMVYFEEICTVRSNNLSVVNANDVNNAERIVLELQENPITAAICNQQSNDKFTVLDQHKVIGYDVLGHTVKSMMDRVIIDHAKKSIQVYDLKCTWTVENFFTEYYLHRRSYIQALCYYTACEHIKSTTPEYADYTVELPKFIVCDSINYFSPLIYTLSVEDLKDALKGFTYNNRIYPGVTEILANLTWAKDHDTWNISKSMAEAGGVINIRHDR
jgi:hypothetical protein